MRKLLIGVSTAAVLVMGPAGTVLAGPPPQPLAGAPVEQCEDMASREHFPLGVNHACVPFPPPGRSGTASGHQ